MHHEVSSPSNLPQGKTGHVLSSEISLELSLFSGSFQSKSKHGGARNMKKAWNKPQETTITKTTKPFLARPKERSSKKICGNKEARYWGCSTSLELYDNPWKIKKALTTSDLGKLNRLLFGADLLESLMLPVLGAEARRDAENGMGAPIRVWDVDTMSMHQLILKRWASFKSYVLIGKWNQDFVRRRDLKKGDVIGLHWDSYGHCFNFSVLKRTQ